MLFSRCLFSLNNIENKKGSDVQCNLICIKLSKSIILTLIVLLGIFLITAYLSDTFCFTKLFKGYAVIQEMPSLKFTCRSLTLCLYAVLATYCFIYIVSHSTVSARVRLFRGCFLYNQAKRLKKTSEKQTVFSSEKCLHDCKISCTH